MTPFSGLYDLKACDYLKNTWEKCYHIQNNDEYLDCICTQKLFNAIFKSVTFFNPGRSNNLH